MEYSHPACHHAISPADSKRADGSPAGPQIDSHLWQLEQPEPRQSTSDDCAAPSLHSRLRRSSWFPLAELMILTVGGCVSVAACRLGDSS
jgi:hypothetical protein